MSRLPPIRYMLTALAVIISTHYIVSYSSPTYASTTSLSSVKNHVASSWGKNSNPYLSETYRPRISPGAPAPHAPVVKGEYSDELLDQGSTNSSRRANATFVILARNSDLWEILASIRGMEGEYSSGEEAILVRALEDSTADLLSLNR